MIETGTFEAMQKRFEEFTKQINELFEKNYSKKMKKWLDNQEVCLILNISKRTLQNYRDKKILPYSQIGYKIYYKPEDIEQFMKKMNNK